jgi:HK97 family phage major capsid protein
LLHVKRHLPWLLSLHQLHNERSKTMTLNELREKRNKLMADASALMQGEVTAEKRTQFDAMLADVTALNGDITRLEAVEQYNREQRAIVPGRPNPGESADPAENAEVRNARVKASFRKYLQTGQIETRDLTVSATGAVVIPQLFDPQVVEAMKSYGELYNMVDVVKTDNGDPMKVVLDDDTANGLVSVTVGTDAAEVDPVPTSKLLQIDTFTTGVTKVDNGLLTDSGFDIESWLRDRFALRFFRGASNLIYSGDTGNVASLASAYTAGFTSSVASKLGYVDFATAIGTLDPAYQPNAQWAVNTATLGYIAGLTDNNGRPLFLPNYGSAEAGIPGTILGRPVRLVTQMPNVTTGNAAVLFGDFKKAYRFRQQNPGLAIIRLNERYAASYETGFVGFARVGGISIQASANVAPLLAITIK